MRALSVLPIRTMVSRQIASSACQLAVDIRVSLHQFLEVADLHDKSLSSGARLSHSAQESAWFDFTERIHHFAVVPLGAVPARNAEPDIHSLYRAVETVTED